jgi:hypothetical protein
VTPAGKIGIPACRARIAAVARRLEAAGRAGDAHELRALLPHMTRNRVEATRNPRMIHPPMTPGIADAARWIKRGSPELTNYEIGVMLGVDDGRVSEALHGLR